MKFLMGSHYWNLNTETSDKDYIEYLVPTKVDLYRGNFMSKQGKDNDGNDVNTKDIRLLIKELKKGSLISFQVLYSLKIQEYRKIKDIKLQNFFMELYFNRDELLEELKPKLLRSCYGELLGRYKKVEAERNTKELVNCVKLIFIINQLLSNKNPFKTWFGYAGVDNSEDYRINTLREIRMKKYRDLDEEQKDYYSFVKNTIESLKVVDFGEVNDIKFSDYMDKILMNLIV